MSTKIYTDDSSSAESRGEHQLERRSKASKNGDHNSREMLEHRQLEEDRIVPVTEDYSPRPTLRLIHKAFEDEHDERLYRDHVKQQKIQLLDSIIVFSISFSVLVIVTRSLAVLSNNTAAISIQGAVIVLDTFLVLLGNTRLIPLRITSNAIYVVWLLFGGQIFCELILKVDDLMPDEKVLWVSLLIYLTFIVLPVRLYAAVLVVVVFAAGDAAVVSVALTKRADSRTVLINQVAANSLIFLAAGVLGVHSFLFADHKQRLSFLEAKSSLKVKVIIEKEYKQHEELLLSVLPKHVADEMLGDLGSVVDGQFRKIYMTRHENVSILFADIVGFTAISSNCTAAELIKVLNELFASFDKLANKFHQLRIKILGDCYYCVCGSPTPRSDHAVLSIHTGLAIVETIRQVRENMKKEVNMRVGIHTGAVLGGVLGQRQFQYDVLGAEVNLANKMESAGIPGRVHISQTTKQFLKDEFELEPGNGDQREDYIRFLGINTYLVKSVLQPYPKGTLDEELLQVTTSECCDEDGDAATREILQKTSTTEEQKHDVEFYSLFSESLMKTRDKSTFWQTVEYITLRFKDPVRERHYTDRQEGFVAASVVALVITGAVQFTARISVLPITLAGSIAFIIGESMLIAMGAAYIVPIICFKVGCDISTTTTSGYPMDPHDERCHYSPYFVEIGSLVFLAVSCLVQISHMVKLTILAVMTTTYILATTVIFPLFFDQYDVNVNRSRDRLPTKYLLSASVVAAALALAYFNRQIDATFRRLFLWKEEADLHKVKVTELRHKNQALIYCLLPAHVAREFVGHRKKDEELYSHAYDEVGVMFAACPNFHDFYNESKVNKNGLECFRFLNEIISDYDELLSQPKFASICKIKTIGTTYMTASGLTTDASSTTQHPWKHLDVLVQFAFLLRETLNNINEQSFNNFILRIGINHGPVIAGVIGAKKPHYDIWGNTVNVASRMESTGRMGKIQITKETMTILQDFGYIFERRGLVKVKGKGEMMTYFIEGKVDESENSAIPHQVPAS
ncbi:adenylate cyclase type 3-like [Gigantopelta aegis]|uniref:adenylate cyclase type 3-like n=1 Tax=Gigantopelta aegis TaxID=1735272 RepID=UPI001B88CFCC|nr:adenylate cyclase type 3-like [Gigantopelta aegis]